VRPAPPGQQCVAAHEASGVHRHNRPVQLLQFVWRACTGSVLSGQGVFDLQGAHCKKSHHIICSQFRADQMPGPAREGQLMHTLILSMRQ
jgi:hypothetical protein